MKLPFSDPRPSGSTRARKAKQLRDLATEVSRLRPQALTRANLEEQDYGPVPHSDKPGAYPTNFTKGLLHDKGTGLVSEAEDYRDFVEAINSEDQSLFEKNVTSSADHFADNGDDFLCHVKGSKKPVKWRGWESPRAGHAYELQGPDSGSVGMAPAPRVSAKGHELAFEMAEVYGLALLRDVPFTEILKGTDKKIDGSTAEMKASEVATCLNSMTYLDDDACLDSFEENRRDARNSGEPLTAETLFRGSATGANDGPYVSQYMLLGSDSRIPGDRAPKDGHINYGSISIDQRTDSHKHGLDYMTDWASWLDVQNGANFKDADQYEPKRRFITTPRDLATYVHFDALYEAYLNAALLMLGNVPASKGFPEPSPSGKRDSFATFGGPHVLSLVTEVATRCLKAVRRQKFNYHRRARPEVMGARYTLANLGGSDALGNADSSFVDSLNELPDKLKAAIIRHNEAQNCITHRSIVCPDHVRPSCHGKKVTAKQFDKGNLLLPMAFPEGSPMHPAYGAGHATVAGGCVTILKAFFEMYEDGDSHKPRKFGQAYEPNATGSALKTVSDELTVQGELNKLAANISIGRNMAGVHYYSDYYDSLRMGERVALGILLEQAPTYGDQMEMRFESFDGDIITLSGEAWNCPSLSVVDKNGDTVSNDDWWLRHVSGEELIEDF